MMKIILTFWNAGKHMKNKFPLLSAMNCDKLTVPTSTVASELALVQAGVLIDPKWTMLSEETVDTCMCLRDQFQAENRTQHMMEEDEIEDKLSTLHI